MIDKIDHYSMNHPATVYDEEALTAVKLAARTAAKVNECVAEVNTIPEKVEGEFEKNLDNGTFDEAIDHYAGDIKKRVENILGGIPTNPTALDAEVVDIRLGENGITYGSAGASVRAQVANTIKMKADIGDDLDLNNKLDLGCYYLSSFHEWKNTPQGMSNAGLLIVLSDTVQGRKTQIFINGQGVAYRSQFVTDKTDGSFSDWKVGASLADVYEVHGIINEELPYKYMNFKEISNAGTVNLDNITDIGCYMFGSSHTLANAPARIGMLLVYKGKNDYNVYQMWYGYDGKIFTRNFIYNEGFTKWTRMLTENDIEAINPTGAKFHVYPVDATTLYIIQHGTKNDIRFTIKRDIESTHTNMVGIRGVHLVSKAGKVLKTITEAGTDIDGVIKSSSQTEHAGGVHGYELMTDATLNIEGQSYDLTASFVNIPNVLTNDVFIRESSTISPQRDWANSIKVPIIRTWEFSSSEGLKIKNRYTFNANASSIIERVELSMMSVEKNAISSYRISDNLTNLNAFHIEKIEQVPPVSDTSVDLISQEWECGTHGMSFFGDGIGIHQSMRAYDSENGVLCQQTSLSFKLKDYGSRLKSYFYIDYTIANDYGSESIIKINS